jgi:hypothetical protein
MRLNLNRSSLVGIQPFVPEHESVWKENLKLLILDSDDFETLEDDQGHVVYYSLSKGFELYVSQCLSYVDCRVFRGSITSLTSI